MAESMRRLIRARKDYKRKHPIKWRLYQAGLAIMGTLVIFTGPPLYITIPISMMFFLTLCLTIGIEAFARGS